MEVLNRLDIVKNRINELEYISKGIIQNLALREKLYENKQTPKIYRTY